MNDTEKEAPCSTNKPDNQKELSLLVESSEKEKVNHTSNGDKSTEVIVVSDNEVIELLKRPSFGIQTPIARSFLLGLKKIVCTWYYSLPYVISLLSIKKFVSLMDECPECLVKIKLIS